MHLSNYLEGSQLIRIMLLPLHINLNDDSDDDNAPSLVVWWWRAGGRATRYTRVPWCKVYPSYLSTSTLSLELKTYYQRSSFIAFTKALLPGR